MSLKDRVKREFKSVGLVMLYFGCWIAALILLKKLVLAEYEIPFHGLSLALVGALILGKVVLVLEHVPLGAWVQTRPAWVDILLRTALYSLGVVVVLVLEKGFEARHEYGGFLAALTALSKTADFHHILVNSICLSGALLIYNTLAVVRLHLGPGGLLRVFLKPPAEETRKT